MIVIELFEFIKSKLENNKFKLSEGYLSFYDIDNLINSFSNNEIRQVNYVFHNSTGCTLTTKDLINFPDLPNQNSINSDWSRLVTPLFKELDELYRRERKINEFLNEGL